MKTLFVLLSSVGLSSCMHLGMMGTGDGHHSGAAHEMTAEPVLEKEVMVGDLRAVATFPPLKIGEDVTLTLRLMDARTSQPISGAKVYLHAQYAHRPTPHDDHAESSPQKKEQEHDINIDQEVTESATPGVYTIPYGSSQTGEHTLMFHITAIGDRKLEPEITLEATRTLSGESHEHQSGMMGGTSTTTYVIIGAAVMGAIMIAMVAARGGMF
ncbi:MAG: hypothetical protein AAB393_05570 [Bacteroidota bacterium]